MSVNAIWQRRTAGFQGGRHGRACPGHPRRAHCDMRGGWVYIMTNRPNETLYTGVTNDLSRRAFEHREGLYEGFTKGNGLARLVWYERHEDIREAIQRERNMKHWRRAWKTRLILDMYPDWRDLYEELAR
jgi:putative endonuclease